jgi:hypothetical protein
METRFPHLLRNLTAQEQHLHDIVQRADLPMQALWSLWTAIRKARNFAVGQYTRDPALCTLGPMRRSLAIELTTAGYTPTDAAQWIAPRLTAEKYRAAILAAAGLTDTTPTTPTKSEASTPMLPLPTPKTDATAVADVQAAVAALAAAITTMKAGGVDESQVAAIVDDRLKAAAPEIAATVGAHLDDRIKAALEKVTLPTRIEYKHAGQVEYRDLGVQHRLFPDLLRFLRLRDPKGNRFNVWISGPAGSGKTSAAEAAADALGLKFYPQGAVSAEHLLFGFTDANGRTHRTPFREAWEHGGVFVLDEADGCDPVALLALNAALANGVCTFPDAVIRRHADCVIVATANTWGTGPSAEYVGRSRLDAASMDRFRLRLDWGYDEAMEAAIVGETGAPWHRFVVGLRRKAAEIGAKIMLTPRLTIAGAALLADGASVEDCKRLMLADIPADLRTRLGIA